MVYCLSWVGCPDTLGTMPRAMRVAFPGAIYHMMALSRRGWTADQEGHPRASRRP